MIRWMLLILGGVLLGGIVHLATVIILPRTATQDAYARLTPIAPVNTVVALPAPTPEKAVMPFMDPAFASAVCRYDLSQGPLKLTVPVSPAYTSVSFYTRNDVAYYAINDRAAGRRVIELDLMTSRAARPGARGRRDHRCRPADRGIADTHRAHRDPGDGAGAGPDARGAGRHCRSKVRHGATRAAAGGTRAARPATPVVVIRHGRGHPGHDEGQCSSWSRRDLARAARSEAACRSAQSGFATG